MIGTGYSSRSRSRFAGFTLVEAMMVVALGGMLAAATMALFSLQRRSLSAIELNNELQMNMRLAMDVLSRDIGMTGYGFPVHSNLVSSWVTWVPGIDSNPMITKGVGTQPDSITLVGAFDPPVGYLSAATTNGQSFVVLQSSAQASQFNTTNRRLVYIGRFELARVVGVNGNVLAVSSSPTSALPLKHAHAAGSPVERVSALTYSCIQSTYYYPYKPHMIREDYLGTMPYSWQRIVASGIENLRFDREPGTKLVSIEVSGRSSRRDPFYRDPTGVNDGYRRSTISTLNRLVNLP